MDLSDINKVANRKRVNTDAEKLREKMSRETSKIIKLRVAQDTAYWDLKERLSGVQAEHERLQQNMLDVQMQHEALSAQYQDELRLRPETLNKLSSTRDICDVLEEYAGRVRASLRRAAADRDALARAYAGAAKQVQAAHAQHAHAAEIAHLQAAAKTDQLRQSEEKGSQLAACASDARRQAEAALAAAAERAGRLRDRAAALRADLQEKERTIAEMQREAERRSAESAADKERAARNLAELQQKLAECGASLAATGEALAATEERAARGAQELARREEAAQNLEKIAAELGQQLETVGAANEELRAEIRETKREASECAARAEAARGAAAEARAELQLEREARAREAAAAGAAAAAAERTLAERADTVARLMRDVADEVEARARCDAALGNALEQARSLTDKMQIKDEELATQVKIVFEMRSEKERLQDIIGKMQGTIDNIQKELTREPPAAAAHAAAAAAAARREPPEHDDNALAAPPKPMRQGTCARPSATDRAVFLTPKPRVTNADDLLYHFLSDSSMDADALDPREVNLRFEALSRGAAPPATSLHALKRRNVADRPQVATNTDVSLSQVKTELAARGRTFFRNKRLDSKPKKLK